MDYELEIALDRIKYLEDENAKLRARLEQARIALGAFIKYKKLNTLNFQLEKADDYFHVMEVILFCGYY